MIIGVDVSHPGVGSKQPSMAAITMSADVLAARYMAAVQTNGVRVEMLTKENIEDSFVRLFNAW